MKLATFCFAVLLGAVPGFAAPDELDDALNNFKEIEAQKDNAKLKESAVSTYALASKMVAKPAPEEDSGKEAWKQDIERGRAVELYVEYALQAAALRGPAASTVDLFSVLQQQNPKSKYLDGAAYMQYLGALKQTGAPVKVQLAAAEKGLSAFPEHPDLLSYLADSAFRRQQMAPALTYSKRLIAVLNKNPKPERNATLARAYYMAGAALASQSKWEEADKNFRAALPLAKGDEPLRGELLFQLGVANYQYGMLLNNKAMVVEAVKFSKEAAEIPGPRQRDAKQNAYVMEQQVFKMR